VYVTHDQVEAMTLGDRVAVMRAGVLQQVDTPQALFNHPVNLFVAAFMGSPSMNLVHADVRDGSLNFGGYTLPLPATANADRLSGRVILGIRPSDFEDAALGRDPHLPTIDVDVDVVEELGTEVHLIFGVAAAPVISEHVSAAQDDADDEAQLLVHDDRGQRSSFTARVDPSTKAHPGERVRLTVDNRAFHFFDASSGNALAGP
jgi:multiple sugar transport system ATP-binding protein